MTLKVKMQKRKTVRKSVEPSLEVRLSELSDLAAEIVDLFYTQTFQPGNIKTPAEVCAAFSEILGRHWRLCCISIFLRGDDGHLRQSASHISEKYDRSKLRGIAELIAVEVERAGTEILVPAKSAPSLNGFGERIAALSEAGLAACFGVPIFARGMLVGALIVLSDDEERLRDALHGIRFIAAPVVIAVGNVRRSGDMQEQHDRIEELVEELRHHSQALEVVNRELRRVALYRSMFLARMSHELRTPLTSVLGFAEILLDHENLSETQRRFCEKIQSSGLQLQVSLNHLVDLSRLEAGQSELFLHEFSIREALRESCAAVNRLAEKRGVEVSCELPEMPSVVSDEGKLRQVLYNFLEHAIGRSPDGSRVRVRGLSASPGRFRVEITDAGDRVSDISKLFEPVDIALPVEKSANFNELGLVIARRLIDVLGGTVELENLSAQGLVVTLDFPTRPVG
jgi:signal transduction histidine kinase